MSNLGEYLGNLHGRKVRLGAKFYKSTEKFLLLIASSQKKIKLSTLFRSNNHKYVRLSRYLTTKVELGVITVDVFTFSPLSSSLASRKLVSFFLSLVDGVQPFAKDRPLVVDACEKGYESTIDLIYRTQIIDKDLLHLAVDSRNVKLVKIISRIFWRLHGEHLQSLYLSRERFYQNRPYLEGKSYTPMHLAAAIGDIEIVKILLENGYAYWVFPKKHFDHDLNYHSQIALNCTFDKDYRRPIHYAAFYGHASVVKLLIEAGAKVDPISAQNKSTPLSEAVQNGHRDVVQVFLDLPNDIYAPNFNRPDFFGNPPLRVACLKYEDLIEPLLEAGADVYQQDDLKQTPLHWACQQNFPRGVEMLLRGGADVNARDVYGGTPLHYAASKGSHTIIQLLLSYGAIQQPNRFGKRPANLTHNGQCLELLNVRKEISPNAKLTRDIKINLDHYKTIPIGPRKERGPFTD